MAILSLSWLISRKGTKERTLEPTPVVKEAKSATRPAKSSVSGWNSARQPSAKLSSQGDPHLQSSNHYKFVEILLRKDLDLAGGRLGADRTNHCKWEIYEKAVKRFNDFVLDGKIPPDLSSHTATRASGA